MIHTSPIRLLIFANVLGFALELFGILNPVGELALQPLHAGFMPWQLLSYAFLHGSPMHLAFNMFGLWMFGRDLEYVLGRRAFLQLYFASVLSAAVMQLFVTSLTGSLYPTVGASGGVFGLLLTYGICFPNRILVLLIPPIPMRAWFFVTIYALIELVLGVTGTQAGVAHFAHLGGMVGAYLLLYHWRQRR